MKPTVLQDPRRRAGLRAALLVGLLLAGPFASAALAANGIEYEVKAGFLFNFLKFTAWPAGSRPQPGAPFRVGVLGDPAVYQTVADALRGKTVGDCPVEVTAVTLSDDLRGFQLVFVPRHAAVAPAAVLEKLAGSAVLLVGDQQGFAADGGVIGLVVRGDNVRFQVNLAAADRANLKLSGHLASLAEIVHPDHP
jgi:hypothetical protein